VVPGERSSGEKRRVGRITKAGNARARWLLVEAAWRIVRSRSEETATLRAWASGIATGRGPPRSPNVVLPARIAMTESGAASATQVMAAGESR